jgi:hypothetical protein
MVAGMPYTWGITGRLDFGPRVEAWGDDLAIADLREGFFAGIGKLKRRRGDSSR